MLNPAQQDHWDTKRLLLLYFESRIDIISANRHCYSPQKPTEVRTTQIIIIIIIISIINCDWVVTRWQWLFYMYTKYEAGY